MKMSKMYMPTLKEVPAEAQIKSHKLLLRAGMIRSLANGLFVYLPLGLRIFRKIENIIREEMNRIGCLEVKPPVVVPGSLWQESGRWEGMGPELLRFKNRLNQDMVISPTAEEVFTSLFRNEAASYKDYPIFVYQINTKYRDEIRPRYGLMRAREFTMKDAYSLHATQESLDEGYLKFVCAYKKIFERVGLSTIEVKASSGAMGGSASQEFMVSSEIGDDTLLICPNCGYAANEEKATCWESETSKAEDFSQLPKLEEVATPNVKTIEELTDFLKCSPSSCIKTLVYHIEDSPIIKEETIALCIRGDLEVNEAKLSTFLETNKVRLEDAEVILQKLGCVTGFLGPVGLKGVPILGDESVRCAKDSVTGAMKCDAHFVHVVQGRDFTFDYVGDFRIVKEGDACPSCHKALTSKKGNELGHVFKLGDKYSRSLNATFLDANGKNCYPLMGCYGIGLDRLVAAVAEEYSDADGLKWPVSVAPYHVVIVPVKYSGEMQKVCDELYDELVGLGLEVLLDDRDARVGVKFKDMDLIGIPYRIVVGEKNLPKLELKVRATGEMRLLQKDELVQELVRELKI